MGIHPSEVISIHRRESIAMARGREDGSRKVGRGRRGSGDGREVKGKNSSVRLRAYVMAKPSGSRMMVKIGRAMSRDAMKGVTDK